MGTRGLLGHIIRGRKKASYNHYDSYPAGLGVLIVQFLLSLSEDQIQEMKWNLANLEWVDVQNTHPSEEIQQRYIAAGFADLGVGNQRASDWYCILRNVQGAAALPHILDGTLGHQIDSTEFEEDTVLCEWTYYIDWEAREVSVRWGEHEEKAAFENLTEEWMEALDTQEEEDSSSTSIESI